MATAGGTLALAVATFASTRSANQAARVAERAMLAGLRPLLLASRPGHPVEKVGWVDEHLAKVEGGQAVVDEVGGVIYLAASLRNAGAGIAVLHGWYPHFHWEPQPEPVAPERFRRLSRDIYIAAGDSGFWQGAIRDADDPYRAAFEAVVAERGHFIIDVLYGDQEGGQRTITRLGIRPYAERWLCTTSRHWNLDRDDPR